MGFLAILGFFEVEGWKSSLLNESIIMTSGESFALLVVDFGDLLFSSFLLFFPCISDFFLRTEIYLCYKRLRNYFIYNVLSDVLQKLQKIENI